MLEAAMKVRDLRKLYGGAKADAAKLAPGTPTYLADIKDMVRAETKRLKHATR